MSTVQEIEHAIGKLSPQEVEELRAWMDEQYLQPIDAQLKADLDTGRIDATIRQTLAEHKAGDMRAI